MSKKIIISNFTRDKIYIVIALLMVFPVTAFAQAPEILWTKIIGGGAQYQTASSVIETPDNGFIIAGSNCSDLFILSDLYILKTNSEGDIIWTKLYGSNANFTHLGASTIEQTSDNSFIITGISYGHYCTDVFLTKINSLGDTLWVNWGLGYAYNPDVKQTFDGGYIISETRNRAGKGVPCGILVKTDPAGNLSWIKYYGVENATSVVQVEDGGYVFTGGFYVSPLPPDAFLIKTNSVGDIIWIKIYDLPDSSFCWC